ncbi:MAG: transcriptional repressor LexA [Candidatus Omnitrophota bacterium]
MEKLTEKQKLVLDFIESSIRDNMPPTIREIAQNLGFSSTGTVRDYLDVLQKKGYLKRSNNKSRAIELTAPVFKGIPILASITAGSPNLAYEDIQGYLNPDDLFLGRLSQNDVFALKVKGNSMIEAGINDGDIAVIKKQPVAHDGDIIAALLENSEATLKIFRHRNKSIYLDPANKDYRPIHKEFSVIGKLITIIRKYI